MAFNVFDDKRCISSAAIPKFTQGVYMKFTPVTIISFSSMLVPEDGDTARIKGAEFRGKARRLKRPTFVVFAVA